MNNQGFSEAMLFYGGEPPSTAAHMMFTTSSTYVPAVHVSQSVRLLSQRCHYRGRKHQPEQEICKGCGGVL